MAESQYSIGQTAERSGLSTHTIRKWEDRHGAVVPRRSAGGVRRYSETQVERLVLLKHLVDAGHGIGSIAAMATDELKRLRSVNALGGMPQFNSLIRTKVVGPTLPLLLEQNRSQMPGIEIVGSALCGDDSASQVKVEAIVIEIPALDESAFEKIEQLRSTCAAQCAVVAYRYASAHTLAKLADKTTNCLRMPVDFREMALAIAAMLADQPGLSALAPAPRRYSHAVLARVAAMQPSVGCECPHHVAELVSALSDFEIYSQNCESKNDQDASLHNYLNIAAGHARASLEAALCAVAEHEGIPLAQWQAQHEAGSSALR